MNFIKALIKFMNFILNVRIIFCKVKRHMKFYFTFSAAKSNMEYDHVVILTDVV